MPAASDRRVVERACDGLTNPTSWSHAARQRWRSLWIPHGGVNALATVQRTSWPGCPAADLAVVVGATQVIACRAADGGRACRGGGKVRMGFLTDITAEASGGDHIDVLEGDFVPKAHAARRAVRAGSRRLIDSRHERLVVSRAHGQLIEFAATWTAISYLRCARRHNRRKPKVHRMRSQGAGHPASALQSSAGAISRIRVESPVTSRPSRVEVT